MLPLLAACDSGAAPPAADDSGLQLEAATPPISIGGLDATFVADISYGSDPEDRFDVFMPSCDEPTPLVVYIHGGGFTGGEKEGIYEEDAGSIRTFLGECIAFASVDYTLLEVPEPATPASLQSAVEQGGVRVPMLDAARALQFMRYHADELNVRPDRVVLLGRSAGAGTSLWLGTHDDLADPDNPDPVLRESTRVTAVVLEATQATYDLVAWEQILAPLIAPFAAAIGGGDIMTVASALDAVPYLFTILGVSSAEEFSSASNVAYRDDVDMLGLMDASDAPIFVDNSHLDTDDLMNVFLHHYLHALAVRDRAEQVGLEVVAYTDDETGAFAYTDPSGETRDEFILRHLQVQ